MLKAQTLKNEPADTYSDRQLMEMLSIRHNLKQPITFKESKKEEAAKILEAVTTVPKRDEMAVAKAAAEIDSAWQNSILIQNIAPESQIKLAKRLTLECLSPARADD